MELNFACGDCGKVSTITTDAEPTPMEEGGAGYTVLRRVLLVQCTRCGAKGRVVVSETPLPREAP